MVDSPKMRTRFSRVSLNIVVPCTPRTCWWTPLFLLEMSFLSLIDNKLTDEDNLELKVDPDDYKITRVVFGFPADKSPSEDGVTYDFLQ